MVHALHGIWRILARGGTLIDLRPLSSRYPVDAVAADTVVPLGEVDGTGMAAEDAAADAAIGEAVQRGWYVQRQESSFEFELYWDSVAEMRSFIASSKRMQHLFPSDADLENEVRRIGARPPRAIRLRCRRPTLLAVYEKATPSASTMDDLVDEARSADERRSSSRARQKKTRSSLRCT